MSNQTPSANPSDSAGNLAGTFRAIFAKVLQGIDGQLPAVVMSYDRVSNTATIRPEIYVVGTDGNLTARAEVARVPVLALGGGGFTIRFPVKAGDRGWLEASDRDISVFNQQATGATSAPPTARTHSFSDGRFIPDSFARAVIAEEDSDAVVIQSLNGGVRLAIGNDGFRFYGAAKFFDAVEIQGKDVATHDHGGVERGSARTDNWG